MKRFFFLILTVMLAATLSACNREGPMEKAGRNIDQAGKDVRDAVKGKK
jgi:predicted small secreted protein